MKRTIYLAGGCFWGCQAYFERLKGVIDTTVGYANGNTINPRYEDLKSGRATHAETVKIDYDDKVISLDSLLSHFLRFVDPYSVNKQGGDSGLQYRSGVYYEKEEDKKTALDFFSSHLKPDYKIQVQPLINFYQAEEYHQNYLDKNPDGYCHVNLNLIKPDEHK